MTRREFELHIAQVETVIKSCRAKFKTKRHQDTYDNLRALFDAVKVRFTNFDQLKLEYCKSHVLSKIYLGIEFLHYKNSSEVPKHLISCLELCLHDWIDNPDFYSITFSHNSSHLQDFMTWTFQDYDLSEINKWTRLNLNVEYEHGLIQISQPRFFNHDFLSNVPCYHELGHFIETTYSIALWIINNKDFEYVTPDFILKSTGSRNDKMKLFLYLREHFSDLFAAQYLGKVIGENLNFVAENNEYGSEHPSTERRKAVIDVFLTGSGNPNDLLVVEVLKESTIAQTKRKRIERPLTDRQVHLLADPFITNKPVKLSNTHEIHSLIAKGWEYFMQTDNYRDPTLRNHQVNKIIRESIELTLMGRKYYSPKKLLSRLLN